MKYKEYYKELSLAATRACSSGIQATVGGNLSMRIPGEDLIIVKSKGGSFADCAEDGTGFVLTDMQGNCLTEGKQPTKEIFLHTLLYSITGCNSVVHCHSPWTVAWSLKTAVLPALTLQSQLKLKYDIPVLPVDSPVVTEEYADMIEQVFADNPALPAFILAGHGIVALGASPILAEQTAEMVEETAKVACINKMIENKKE